MQHYAYSQTVGGLPLHHTTLADIPTQPNRLPVLPYTSGHYSTYTSTAEQSR